MVFQIATFHSRKALIGAPGHLQLAVTPVGPELQDVYKRQALAIAIPRIAMTVKMLRGSIKSELERDYVRTAQSRGNARRAILGRHVVRNAMIPVITFLAISMAEIMTGTIVVEQVFTVPGIGRLLISSISSRDFPVVQAIVVIMAAWIVLVNFLADVINQLVDPRIRLQ